MSPRNPLSAMNLILMIFPQPRKYLVRMAAFGQSFSYFTTPPPLSLVVLKSRSNDNDGQPFGVLFLGFLRGASGLRKLVFHNRIVCVVVGKILQSYGWRLQRAIFSLDFPRSVPLLNFQTSQFIFNYSIHNKVYGRTLGREVSVPECKLGKLIIQSTDNCIWPGSDRCPKQVYFAN